MSVITRKTPCSYNSAHGEFRFRLDKNFDPTVKKGSAILEEKGGGDFVFKKRTSFHLSNNVMPNR